MYTNFGPPIQLICTNFGLGGRIFVWTNINMITVGKPDPRAQRQANRTPGHMAHSHSANPPSLPYRIQVTKCLYQRCLQHAKCETVAVAIFQFSPSYISVLFTDLAAVKYSEKFRRFFSVQENHTSIDRAGNTCGYTPEASTPRSQRPAILLELISSKLNPMSSVSALRMSAIKGTLCLQNFKPSVPYCSL